MRVWSVPAVSTSVGKLRPDAFQARTRNDRTVSIGSGPVDQLVAVTCAASTKPLPSSDCSMV